MIARVHEVRSVDLAVRDVAAMAAFFTDVWNLSRVADADGVVYLRAAGPAFHAVSLRQAEVPAMVRIVLGARSRADVDALHRQVAAEGAPTDGAPRPLTQPGGGYGFGFRDPEGRNYAIVAEAADHADGGAVRDRPTKISHVNLNAGDNDATFGFLSRALGFTLSDQTRQFRFIRCNADHHSLVIGFNEASTLNHIAFEMPTLDDVMRGIGRMRDHGYGVEWGPGRHGPGNNVFAYFCGPEELPLEYTSEMNQVDGSYRVGRPEDWRWPPGRVDQWGIMAGPSARVKAAALAYRFTEDGFRLAP